MLILSIDIGIVHFAFVFVKVVKFKIEKVLDCQMFDIRDCTQKKCKPDKCPWNTSKTHSHYLHHVFEMFRTKFERADVILVEQVS